MSKPLLVISELVFDVAAISEALHVSEADTITALSDGRGAWPFSEMWGQKLYEFVKHTNSNAPLSDGAFVLGQLGNASISVKALTKAGVKFQQSKYVGIGRKSTKETLISSLEACDRVVVVDIVGFPTVRFIPIDATRLISAAHKERLTSAGWTKAKLYAWLKETYTVSEITLTP